MPGFTHLQTAQFATFRPSSAGLVRDALPRTASVCWTAESGSIACCWVKCAGRYRYPIDRALTCELLGFEAVSGNSLDGVSDRDFAIEFRAAAALAMMHPSRFSEELVLWTARPVQLHRTARPLRTGSSIMPQKKNPDVPELVRGKSGRKVLA